MLEETSGRSERRATSIVLIVLAIETLWSLLHKYLPLDAGLWSLQSELVRLHMSGHTGDGWKLIPFPASNVLVPLVSGMLTSFFSGEIAVRLLLVLVGIFVRGSAMLLLFRTMRVRDEAVYYLIPVYVWSAIWFSGALPYLVGETAALLTLAFFLSQSYPRNNAYWIISIGLAVTALSHALAFLFAAIIILSVSIEQRRSVHLSQGWLSSGRTVLSLLLPGLALILLSIFVQQPIFAVSTSKFLPISGVSKFLFFVTPAPAVLEATIKYGSIFHGILSIGSLLIVIVHLLRAVLLPMEEVTWQSRSLKLGGGILMVLSIAATLWSSFRLDTSAWIGAAMLVRLAGSYSRGPGVRRTLLDRALITASLVAMIATGLINAVGINRGSAASEEVLTTSRHLIQQAKVSAQEDEHIDSLNVQLLIDSALAQDGSANILGTYSYSLSAPLYLYGEKDLLHAPYTIQPIPGSFRQIAKDARRNSPVDPPQFTSPERYVDSSLRLFTVLPSGSASSSFGPYDLHLVDTIGLNVSHGESSFHLLIGRLSPGRVQGLALR